MTRFMILTKFDPTIATRPMSEWDPADVQAHLDCLTSVNNDLAARGELVEMNALTGPELARIVTADGVSVPVVTDGPFGEAKELLAGYQMVDVESQERAVEIVQEFMDDDKLVAAICHAPWLLVEADVVDGRRMTSWPSVRTDLENAGADVVDEAVVVDGNLVTSRKPDDIPQFNAAIIAALAEEFADEDAAA